MALDINKYIIHFNDLLVNYLNKYSMEVPLIGEAVKYSILNGGKRIRPILVYLGAEFCNKNIKDVDSLALGIEMIHSYSLVHDDLPCMDNDDLRRGKLTTHKKYGEAIGVLAGDGLLTLAFETMLNDSTNVNDCKAIKYIAYNAGINGMVGGQCIDLNNNTSNKDLSEVLLLNRLKTSCLIQSALVGSAIRCGASNDEICDLEFYSKCIGQIFQLVDDILDINSNNEIMGKTVGKDKAQNKNTYISIVGEEATLKEIQKLEKNAITTLSKYGDRSKNLIEFAKFLTKRAY